MSKRLLYLGALLLTLLATAARPASAQSTAYARRTLLIRAAPSALSLVRATVPAGGGVTILRCDSAWCFVRYGARVGYARARYLAPEALPKVTAGGRGYTNSQGIWVPSPVRTPDGLPPPGASAR